MTVMKINKTDNFISDFLNTGFYGEWYLFLWSQFTFQFNIEIIKLSQSLHTSDL